MLLLTLFAACSPTEPRSEHTRSADPGDQILSVRDLSSVLAVRLNNGHHFDSVLDMTIFGPLRPKMTVDDARAILGEPTSVATDYRGTFYAFVSSGRKCAVAHISATDWMSGTMEDWAVYAYPPNASVVSSRLQSVIAAHPNVEQVAVTTNYDDRSIVVLYMNHGLLTEVRWSTE